MNNSHSRDGPRIKIDKRAPVYEFLAGSQSRNTLPFIAGIAHHDVSDGS